MEIGDSLWDEGVPIKSIVFSGRPQGKSVSIQAMKDIAEWNEANLQYEIISVVTCNEPYSSGVAYLVTYEDYS